MYNASQIMQKNMKSILFLKVGFHWRVFWLRTLTHVNFNHVNKIEVRLKVLSLNKKWSEVASILFANVNLTQVRT